MEGVTFSEFLDVGWVVLMGQAGAFSNPAEYRASMTALMYDGKLPQKPGESSAESVKQSIGAPVPQDAMAEARSMMEAIRNQAKPKE